jgi:hypothetical protein
LGDDSSAYRFAPLLLANLNSFALDFIARQKVHGNHLNFYIVEQLPMVPEAAFKRVFGKWTATDCSRRSATLNLHCT